ncbi:MAG TPA: right-handed parallel beta-helix repeat-containing protein [Phycisphaerae bacterium]|nr:right-handed parallel beta-helix repeat-containing protein [Phycisphaerae bacterium]
MRKRFTLTSFAMGASISVALLGRVASVLGATLNVPAQYATIQAAINAARPGDEVVIADGVYSGTGNKNLDFKGKAITVRSASGDAAACVIDCQGSGRGLYFHSGESAGSVLQGLTIRSANCDVGAVYCQNASPTLVDCMIRDSTATFGAGVYCENGASPTLTNCTLANNTASCGGGIGCAQDSDPTLTNCIMRDNLAAYGAGLWCYQNSCPTLTGCLISGNRQSDYGAGVECDHSNPTLTDCTLTGNQADYGGGALHCRYASPMLINCMISGNSGGYRGGGGLCSRYGSNPVLTDCTITGNTSNNGGGGIFCEGASATLANCTVRGNTACYGGGMDCLLLSSPMLTNCVITDNHATCRGGGVRCDQSSPTLTNCLICGNAATGVGGGVSCESDSLPTLTNCTVAGNMADAGGGLACSEYANPSLTNCILWGDTPQEVYLDSSTLTMTYCDVQGGWSGVGNINADPLFADPDGLDNDPSTGQDNDYHLSLGSPCIDAGDNAAVPLDTLDLDGDGDTTEPLPFDLGGHVRLVDNPAAPDTGAGWPPIVDMGAYEYQGTLPVGDMDCDGDVDMDDVFPFALALIDPTAYQEQQPNCHPCQADMDHSAGLDGLDIQPFVDALLGS